MREGPGRTLRLGRWLVLVPLSALCAWSLLGPPSLEAALFALAVLGATVGAFLPSPGPRRWALGVGLGLATLVMLVRLGVAREGETLRNLTAPDRPGRFIDRLLPERDVALGGSRLLMVTGAMPDDVPGLLDHLSEGYDRMREAEGAVPSPVLGTLLFGQTPEDHGVLRVAPEGGDGKTALVFLHGFMGSTTVACWHVAQAASPLGIETLCPAMDWRARWETPAGRAIARQTIAEVRAAGAERVVLAGLSAGAIGASKIARDLDVDAVILISGASRHPRPARLPTLVLQGDLDQMTPPRFARAYADRVRGSEYVAFPDAGHWLVLSHHAEVTRAIRRFLEENR